MQTGLPLQREPLYWKLIHCKGKLSVSGTVDDQEILAGFRAYVREGVFRIGFEVKRIPLFENDSLFGDLGREAATQNKNVFLHTAAVSDKMPGRLPLGKRVEDPVDAAAGQDGRDAAPREA